MSVLNIPQHISTFASFCEKELNLHRQLIVEGRTDPNETFYKSLPICIMDAVFSIGVNYQSVEKAEHTFIEHFKLNIPRSVPVQNEYTIHDFLAHMATFSSFEEAASVGFNNRQRTSSRNGILKAEACVRVAEVCKNHNINTLDDFRRYTYRAALDADICMVKGQGSGIMLKYLYMLAGDADFVKPDRHLVNFMKNVYPHLTMSAKHHPEIIAITQQTVSYLQPKYPMLTPRFLDVLIWEHMR